MGAASIARGGPPFDLAIMADPDQYAAHGKPHELWDWMRRELPVAWVEPERIEPFWAVTRWDDIRAVENASGKLFLNKPRNVLDARKGEQGLEGLDTLLEMDPPKHGRYRQILKSNFTVHGLDRIGPVVASLADRMREAFIALARTGEPFDFVDLARIVPLYTIGRLVGLSDPISERCNELVDIVAAPDDQDFGGADRKEGLQPILAEFASHFLAVMNDRAVNPQDDLVSDLLKAAQKDPPEISHADVLSYLTLMLIAGNDTTRASTVGGVRALAEHPGELRKLQRDMSLMPGAIEEILRWTSPVIHFCRTAAEDTDLRGAAIKKGDALAVFYPSGNRDSAAFDAPYEFKIERAPNLHMTFGFGPHTCLGANLARRELAEIYQRIVPLIDEIEICDVAYVRSNINGATKSMRIRVKLDERAVG